VNKKGADR